MRRRIFCKRVRVHDGQQIVFDWISCNNTNMKKIRYKLVVHSPLTHSNIIREGLSEVGAGTIGNYDSCSFSYLGTGRFRGNEKSNQAIGVPGKIEEVEEESIEIVMEESILRLAIQKLKEIHPYEEPAYEVYKLEDF
jgi:hypothetical protein